VPSSIVISGTMASIFAILVPARSVLSCCLVAVSRVFMLRTSVIVKQSTSSVERPSGQRWGFDFRRADVENFGSFGVVAVPAFCFLLLLVVELLPVVLVLVPLPEGVAIGLVLVVITMGIVEEMLECDDVMAMVVMGLVEMDEVVVVVVADQVELLEVLTMLVAGRDTGGRFCWRPCVAAMEAAKSLACLSRMRLLGTGSPIISSAANV
jgi:hypothetical protein